MFNDHFPYKYCPILAISPSEITAFKELPSQDKDQILPIFPIKSWATAHHLSGALNKVKESVGESRKWIANIDYDCFESRLENKYKEVHWDLKKLADSSNGYFNWFNFIKGQENIIPCLQKRDIREFQKQVALLDSLSRGMVLILTLADIKFQFIEKVANNLQNIDNLLIILDLEQISSDQLAHSDNIVGYLRAIKALLPKALLSLSSTSFPDSFGGYHKGVKTIYERALYDRVSQKIEGLVYSDRGSARALKGTGGGGLIPPRIDYATNNEWYFIRKEYPKEILALEEGEGKKAAVQKEKKSLYTKIAQQIMLEDYWEEELTLYSNYLIELTAKGDDYGINSPQKATAVRINKHLHSQLYYNVNPDEIETDEDWID